MQAVTTIGLDIAKSVFQVHGIDAEGKVVIRRQLKRRYVLAFFQKLPSCLVGIEACASSHHWSASASSSSPRTKRSTVAIDGSKFKAVNNRDKSFTRAKMERRLAQIEESVARYLQQLDSADRQEPSLAQVGGISKRMIASIVFDDALILPSSRKSSRIKFSGATGHQKWSARLQDPRNMEISEASPRRRHTGRSRSERPR
jgi:transposase